MKKTLIYALMFLLCGPVFGVEVVRYVDTASVGGDGTTDALTGANAAYTLGGTWESTEGTNLVSDGDTHTVNFAASTGIADALFHVNGFTTGAANYLTMIVTDSDGTGIKNNTTYRIEGTNASTGMLKFSGAVKHVRATGFQLHHTLTSTTGGYGLEVSGVDAGASDYRFNNFIITTSGGGTGATYGMLLNDPDMTTVRVWNTNIYSAWQYGVFSQFGTVNMYNANVRDARSGGIRNASGGTVTATNCTVSETIRPLTSVTADYCSTLGGEGTNAQFPSGTVEVMGSTAENRTSASAVGRTWLLIENPATGSGTITGAVIWASTTVAGAKIGSFFNVSGTTWECRDSETIGAIENGYRYNVEGLSVSVEAGDLLGFYTASGAIERTNTGEAGYHYIDSDAMTPTAQNTFTLNPGLTISVEGIVGADWTKDFTDPDNGDFRPVAEANIIGNGLNDPGVGLFSTDIIEEEYVTDSWNIGAYAGVASSGQLQIFFIKAYWHNFLQDGINGKWRMAA